MSIDILILFKLFDNATQTYVYNGYNALVDSFKPMMTYLVILALIYKGYKMWFETKISMEDLWWFFIKVACIYTIGLQWGNFSYYFLGFFNSYINYFSSTMLEANPIAHIPAQYTSIDSSLQLAGNLIFEVAHLIVSDQTWYNFDLSLWFDFGVVWLMGFAMILMAIVDIILAKFVIAVLFTITPMMFVCLLFPYTQKLFDKWLGALVGLSLVFILVSAALGMLIGMIYTLMPVHEVTNVLSSLHVANLGFSIFPLIFMLGIAISAMSKIVAIAMDIGGSAAGAGASGVIGGMMMGAMLIGGRTAFNKGRGLYGAGLQKLKDYGEKMSKSK